MDGEKVAGMRALVARIQKLKSQKHHRHIFHLLRNVPHSKNENGPMFNLARMSDSTLLELRKYVDLAEETENRDLEVTPRVRLSRDVPVVAAAEPESDFELPVKRKRPEALARWAKFLRDMDTKHHHRKEATRPYRGETSYVGPDMTLGDLEVIEELPVSLAEEHDLDPSLAHPDGTSDQDEEQPDHSDSESSSPTELAEEDLSFDDTFVPDRLRLTPVEKRETEVDQCVTVWARSLRKVPFETRLSSLVTLLRESGINVATPEILRLKTVVDPP